MTRTMLPPGLSERGRDLIHELIARDVRLRYRRSVLGLLWSQLNPLAQIVIFSVIFTRVVPLKIPDYPLFVFVGVVSWQWFEAGILDATTSVVSGRDLIRQPGFPARVLPPLAVASGLVHYVLSLPVFFVVMVLTTGRVRATATALVPLMALQFLVCLGPAYLLATLHVFLRDTAQIVGIALRVMFFLTPVIYDAGRLTGSRFRFLYVLNPMAHLVTAQRDVLIFGRSPRIGPLAVIAVAGLALFFLGRSVFAAAEGRFPEET